MSPAGSFTRTSRRSSVSAARQLEPPTCSSSSYRPPIRRCSTRALTADAPALHRNGALGPARRERRSGDVSWLHDGTDRCGGFGDRGRPRGAAPRSRSARRLDCVPGGAHSALHQRQRLELRGALEPAVLGEGAAGQLQGQRDERSRLGSKLCAGSADHPPPSEAHLARPGGRGTVRDHSVLRQRLG